jgi:hypothetical protein
MRRAALAAAAILATTACGVRQLPPPAAPDKVVPELDEPPPPPEEGRGVVVVDVTNGPAKVYEVLGTTAAGVSIAGRYGYASSVTTRVICNSTPCFATGPLGAYTLVLESTDPEKIERNVRDTVNLDLRRRPTVVRHAFGEGTRSSTLATVGAVTAMALGGTGVLVGGPVWLAGSLSDSTSDLASVGQTVFLAGAVTLGAGILLAILGRPTHQSGATTQWTLPNEKGPAVSPSTYPGANTF